MMAVTHLVFALAGTCTIVQSSDPVTLALAGLGSQLPDLDTSQSSVGRLAAPISRAIESRFPHRSVTHSFLATFCLAVISLPVGLISWEYWNGLVLGFFFGWFADCFTKSGVAAFFPSQARLVIPGNPRLRIGTNTPAEWVFLCLALLVLSFSLWVNSSGGLLRSLNAWLGTPSGAVELVDLELDYYELYAKVTGRIRASSQKIEKTFRVVQTVNSQDLLVTDGENLYQVGRTRDSQIISRRIRISRGRPVKTVVASLEIGEGTELNLEGIPSDALITGQVLVEDGFGLTNPPRVTTYNPVTLVFLGGETQIRFQAASPDIVRQFLEGRSLQGGQLVARYYL